MAEEGGRGGEQPDKPASKFALYLRECLLLLAIQVVTVTYAAGLNPPGGVWPETKDGHLTGNSILAVTNHVRYTAFSCSNTIALMASGAVVLLLLFVRGERIGNIPWFNTVLRCVMSLGMLALAVAYAAGASRHKFTTNYASASLALLFLCVVIFTSVWISKQQDFSLDNPAGRAMFSAVFVMSMAYTAGLSPPGAFWLDTQEGHLAGDPALPVYHWRRFKAFFVGNTMAFVGSLFIIPMVLTDKVDQKLGGCSLYIYNTVAGNGLMIAYAAGSCVDKAYIAYVLLSASAIVPAIALMLVVQWYIWPLIERAYDGRLKAVKELLQKYLHNGGIDSPPKPPSHGGMPPFFIVLFTTISATVTYQAGLNPPGGLWLDDLDSHKAGDPILLAKQPTRYRVFMFCNSMALVASLVSIVMALTKRCQDQRSHALDGLMLLDLVCLIGAYAAGCCRDVQTSIYVISLGGAIIVYVVFHMAFLMPRDNPDRFIKEDKKVELDRDLMLGILGAALTYQTGLTPPGGFWQSDDEFGHHAGEPVLLSTYPSRYKVFFYLNALCFMASVFLTILFVNPILYRAGIRCRALFVCVLAVLFGLMGGYAAGSYRNLGSSITIVVLGAAIFLFVISILYLLHRSFVLHKSKEDKKKKNIPKLGDEQEQVEQKQVVQEEPKEDRKNTSNQRSVEQVEQQVQPTAVQKEEESTELDQNQNKALSYLVLIGSIGATVTYQAGFAPPRSFWPDNRSGHTVGNPALRDMDAHRYRLFFFFNTTSFAASVLIMMNGGPIMLVLGWLFGQIDIQAVYTTIQAPTTVYAIGILGAYAAGSSSGWNNTSVFAVALVAPVLFCIFFIDPMVKLFGKLAKWMEEFNE